jgi:hypothetical protein
LDDDCSQIHEKWEHIDRMFLFGQNHKGHTDDQRSDKKLYKQRIFKNILDLLDEPVIFKVYFSNSYAWVSINQYSKIFRWNLMHSIIFLLFSSLLKSVSDSASCPICWENLSKFHFFFLLIHTLETIIPKRSIWAFPWSSRPTAMVSVALLVMAKTHRQKNW